MSTQCFGVKFGVIKQLKYDNIIIRFFSKKFLANGVPENNFYGGEEIIIYEIPHSLQKLKTIPTVSKMVLYLLQKIKQLYENDP